MVSDDKKLLAVATHLLTFISAFIAPLIILLVVDDRFVKNNAKAALNWQISAAIYMLVSAVLMLILVGFLLAFILAILNMVLVIIAAIRASENKVYIYPLAIPFFSIDKNV